jgi:DNA-binding transcriptional LysR family regulator
MYTIQGLRAFVAVCQQGSVTAAAEAIHRTQPQVSRLISELEADLGFALFVREGRRITPTIRGVRFFEEARRTLASFDDIERVVSELRVEKDAPVRILAPPHAVHTVIPPAIARVRKKHPELHVQVEIITRSSIGTWSAYRPFDIGIAALPFDLPWIRKEPLARTKMLLLVPAKHPLASVERVSAADTAKYPLVALQPAAFARQQMEEQFQLFGITPDIVCETESVMSACQMVAHGIGLTPVDPLLMTAVGLTGVKAVEWEIPIYLEYCLFRPVSGATSELVGKFRSALHEVVSEICGGAAGRSIKRLPAAE